MLQKLPFFNVQRARTPKVCNLELRFLRSGCCQFNICIMFHEIFLNGFDVTERTRVCGKNCHFSMIKRPSP